MTPTLDDVEMAVCARFALPRAAMRVPDRRREVARPRQIAMFLAREATGLSLPRIGRHFCRDHTTVLHAMRRIAAMMATDARLAAEVTGCRALLARAAQCKAPAEIEAAAEAGHAAGDAMGP